jgi:7-carboxy-7-deazaguanine synthase
VNTTVKVTETFVSLQGESTWAGSPCFFVRLSGCNLRCRYCDTRHAYAEGVETPVAELVEAFHQSRAPLAEITGGEPLLQAGFPELAVGLRERDGKTVLVETNGSLDLSLIPAGIIAVMDLKCPGSGESGAMDMGNLRRLRSDDEVKFVIGDRADFDWACEMVGRHGLASRCRAVLFSPVFGVLAASTLGAWLVEARLPVRLQLPLHKMLEIR